MSQAIQVKRFNQVLGRALGMAGVLDPAGELSPEISAVLALEVDRPEWKFLGGEALYALPVAAGASALAPSFCRAVNPANSGVIAVIEAILYSAAGVTFAEVGIGAPAANRTNAANLAAPRDSRFGAVTGAALRGSADNAVLGGNIAYWELVLANTTVELLHGQPIVLAPDSFVDAGSSTNNNDANVVFLFRERAMEPYEARR